MKKIFAICFLFVTVISCQEKKVDKIAKKETKDFVWEGANIYFLLTDRFNNGDKTNDVNFNRTKETGVLRGFEGGDIKGITEKIKEGYFTNLGINAIWMTPIVEQIHDATDEGTGNTYGFHGYWAKDWTKIDPNFGTTADLKELVSVAHKNGIRVLLDAVINHTGPVTEKDAVWPNEWVRTQPQCKYSNYENTIKCTLVKNLPDIRTDSNENVELPPQLVAKWKSEGRYEQEIKELNAFFERTGHPRAPRFYIMKWLTDYITEFGIDGYRVDTVKHTEEYVWQEFRTECDFAFEEYKKNNPEKVLDKNDFYLVGEVYNYAISHGKSFDFGDKKVNYFDKAFDALINFEIKWNAKQMKEADLFKKYNEVLQDNFNGFSVLNYMTSHDDGQPFDKERKKPYKTATMLLLTPGTSQVYYGDESARDLTIKGAIGDATLRSFMNWDALESNDNTKDILNHWQKLGQFRANHMSIGAGKHKMIPSENGVVFSRKWKSDKIIAGINLPKGKKTIETSSVFKNGDKLKDFYSNQIVEVKNGKVTVNSNFDIVLLEKI
ncbi:alpha-amylase family glycosyl hydrolase [Polaribacter porphyrae]|uniref:Alpha-amlyase n=1 Tax=Polaribacter porphyrae TaxID=1137780 RepID=A0A2S7WMB2_9FLAO|nr:alpha-amylase family glycosyl hydrolase [Polaribacter porphyrae]PQJ78719.1 alpha-amlyase [Polaribacter porphyrae]